MLKPLKGEKGNHRSTIEQLRAVMNDLPDSVADGFITGEPVMVTDGLDMVEQDGWRLTIVSTVLLATVLLIVFRSLRWALIPLAVVHWSIIVTQAILAVAQLELTMVSSMLTAIITVVGVATSMHLLLGYQQIASQWTRRPRGDGPDDESAAGPGLLGMRDRCSWLHLAIGS